MKVETLTPMVHSNTPKRPTPASRPKGIDWDRLFHVEHQHMTKTMTQIANEQGCSVSAVCSALRRRGLTEEQNENAAG